MRWVKLFLACIIYFIIIVSLSYRVFSQNLVGAVHSYAAPQNAFGQGLIGYNVGFCNGELSSVGQFDYNVYNGVTKKMYGEYVAVWIDGPNYTVNNFIVNKPVVTISGMLLGTWTPTTGPVQNNIYGWFQDYQMISDPQNIILGCGGLDIDLITGGQVAKP